MFEEDLLIRNLYVWATTKVPAIEWCEFCEKCGAEVTESRIYISGWKFDTNYGNKYRLYRIRLTCPNHKKSSDGHTDGAVAHGAWVFTEEYGECEKIYAKPAIVPCPYCKSDNAVTNPTCVQCGGPLGA